MAGWSWVGPAGWVGRVRGEERCGVRGVGQDGGLRGGVPIDGAALQDVVVDVGADADVRPGIVLQDRLR